MINLISTESPTISSDEYSVFKKQFVFEKLKGIKFGEAFCQKFNFDDYILKNLSDETAQYHIETLGYIK